MAGWSHRRGQSFGDALWTDHTGYDSNLEPNSARPSLHHLSLCSFVFLQLYHSPFFGDESNKPILLPNEVGMPSLTCRGPWNFGRGNSGMRDWVVVATVQACKGLHPVVIYQGGESPPLSRYLAEAGWAGLVAGDSLYHGLRKDSVATDLRAVSAAP